MFAVYLCALMVGLSPILFNEELRIVCKKIARKCFESMAKDIGYDQMLQDIVPHISDIEGWQELLPERPKDDKTK